MTRTRQELIAGACMRLISTVAIGACAADDTTGAPGGAASETTQAAVVSGQKQLEPVSFNCGFGGFRCQTADIAEVSATDFVVAYINASGQLKYAYYGATGQEVAPFAKGTSAKWVRANSSKPWGAFGCSSTYFAVQVDDPQLGGPGVYLDAHSKCASGWSNMTRTLIAAGGARSPSVATKGDALWGDVFIAWDAAGSMGRLLRHRFQNPGAGLTQPFAIGALAGSGTDVIYNQHSNRWIVGQVARGFTTLPNVNNAVLTSDWALLPEVIGGHNLGSTGGPNDGHHNYVAYSALSDDGSYLHWYQGTDGKGIYTHASDGSRMFSVAPFDVGNGLTVPLAPTYSAATPYVAWATNGSGTDVYGRRQDKTWTLLGQIPGQAMPVTVRALPNTMVGLFASGRLVFADFPFSTRMATLQMSTDQRLIYANGEGDSIFQKWKTSSAGNGTWSAATLVNQPWNKAKDVAVEVSANGLLEAIYIGTDDTIYRTTQSSSDVNAWTGEQFLFDADTKARAIAVSASPIDGRLAVFFARRSDSKLFQTWQTSPGSSTWTTPTPVANTTGTDPNHAFARSITVFVNSNSRLEIVYTRLSGTLLHTFQTSSADTSWSIPTLLNGATDTATRMVKAHEPIGGRRLIYTSGGNDQLYETRQTAPGVWNGQSPFGGTIWHNVYDIAVAKNGDGVLEVFAVGTDNAVTHRRQTTAGGPWGGSLGFFPSWITAKRLTVSRNAENRLELYYVGMDNVIYHTSQVNPNGAGGNWHAPAPL
jgi:hypothetical protein